MVKQLLSGCTAIILAGLCAVNAGAQAARSSVAASEVNGTFRSYFTGKYKGSFNEIKILALGPRQAQNCPRPDISVHRRARRSFGKSWPINRNSGDLRRYCGLRVRRIWVVQNHDQIRQVGHDQGQPGRGFGVRLRTQCYG